MSNNIRLSGRRNILSAAVLMLIGQAAMAGNIENKQAIIDRALGQIQAHPTTFQLPAQSLSSSAQMLTFKSPVGSASLRAGADRSPARASNSTGDQFEARDVIVDRDGTEHVRFERYFGGLHVIGGDLVTHTSAGQLKSASLALKTSTRPKLVPRIGVDQAIVEAGAAFSGTVASAVSEGLVIYATDGSPKLAYAIHVRGGRTDGVPVGNVTYYIDALNGELIGIDDHIETAQATGKGKSLTMGDVEITTDSANGGFRLVDPLRGNGMTYDARNTPVNEQTGEFDHSVPVLLTDADNVWGNNAVGDRASGAVDVHYGVAATWDFFEKAFGRHGIFDDGKGVVSYVHLGKNYNNAFWSGEDMNYGDGNLAAGYLPLVALDVAGHEMSHGINQATANLGYYLVKDSGGLNEGNSDILGTLVEFSTNNPVSPGNYLIGENVVANNPNKTKALRLMFKQDADGASYSCYPVGGFTKAQTAQSGKYDPHYSSGVANRFFYLLAEGAVVPAGFQSKYVAKDLVCNDNTNIVGIGREKAGNIWYRALTTRFVSNTDYPGARDATLAAAADLYGANSTEWKAVATAWSAVKVGTDSYPPGGGGAPVANFTAAANGLTASFTNSSTDTGGKITAYAWTFGDSSTSSVASPSHTYVKPGTYTVTLKVTDDSGATDTKTQSVTVSDDTTPPVGTPVANFTSSVNGLIASFTNSSTDTGGTISAYAWSFGDGGTSAVANPSHTYAAAGTYTVSLKVTDNTGATNTKTQQVTVSGGGGNGNVFSSTMPVAIGSNATITSSIAVSGIAGNASKTLKIHANITHNKSGDLQIRIIAPNGASAVVKSPTFSGGGNIDTTWTIDASGVKANGTWKLQVIDYDLFRSGDKGTLNNWNLTF
ncbi:PKD domain-containing protein [Rhodanobacter sp. Col0626]|uniref:PKD domain-containing protein n=1 Tax=Rhodanobacter sp. Col0626 TaxID=3415679 RepID=UPI003CE7CC4E